MDIRTLRLTPVRDATSWLYGESLSWKALAAGLSALLRVLRPPLKIRVSRVSVEWLRAHEIESAKHRDDF